MKPVMKRCMVVFAILILIILYGYLSYRLGIGIPCLFYQFTGWRCPGCGLGRSVRCILAGDWRQAFEFNPLLMPCIIPGTLFLLYTAWQYIIGTDYRNYAMIHIMERFGLIIAGILILYGILRNIFGI